MLPGFRFLLAATFFSMSILVFGLGAAALLRAAHEQFATNPSWHAAPEATFAQQVEPARPVLAMLRVGTPASEQKATGNIPESNVSEIPAPPEQAATAPSAAAESDTPVPESPAPGQAAAAPADVPASAAMGIATAASGGEAQIASMDRAALELVAPPSNEAATGVEAAASSPAGAPVSPEASVDATNTAMLESPSVTVEARPPANAVSAKPDPSVVKKQLRARRAAHRRRMAARAARLARLAALQQLQQLQQQQALNPFAQQFAQPAATATVRSR